MFILIVACQSPGGNSTGSEYMPDMAHSIAYEANYYNYYYNNTWSDRETYHKFAQPRQPVEGTVPRGGGVKAYAYGNTEEERTRATAEILNNPFPITDAGLKEGKALYDTFCGICHGEAGDGAGYLVRDDGGKYPVQPANFLLDEFIAASNGRYYHAIMHGKNLMGAYADKIDYEERWQVIHYIRALQAKDKKLAYNQMENTYNSTFGEPAGEIVLEEVQSSDEAHSHSHGDDHHDGHHKDDHHGDNHDHDHEHDHDHNDHDHHGDEHENHDHENGHDH